jgi:hypothetical protein
MSKLIWESLAGVIRKGVCASANCWGEPMWRLVACDLGSHYCRRCRDKIDAGHDRP